MRVLHIIADLGTGGGGAETVLYRLCRYGGEIACHSVVSLKVDGFYSQPLRNAGVEVHSLGMPPNKVTLAGLRRLNRIVRTSRPDIVQTWMHHSDLIGGVVARLSGVANVVWGIRGWYPESTPLKTRLVLAACARLSRLVPAHIVSCSEKAKSIHVNLGYPAEKISVIPNGFDCADFAPDIRRRKIFRQELGLSEDVPVIGTVARFHPQKDHANLISALSRLAKRQPTFVCLLVGSGVDETNTDLLSQIRRCGLVDRIRLLGPRSDIPTVMNGLDIHVLPSAYGEAFPNVVAESMACGVPNVVTDVGDASEIVDETGWIVPPKDPDALVKAIEAGLQEKARTVGWRQRQNSCRERIVANFDLARMLSAYETTWRNLLK